MAVPSESLSGLLQEPDSRGLAVEDMGFISKKFIGAVKDEWTLFSDRASDYTIGEPIGHGASSIVYAATFHPPVKETSHPSTPIPCALKVLDLDSLPRRSLQLLQRETTLMSLSKHPNVLRVRGSWMDGHKLCIALRLMNKGSAADVMRYGWPGGMEEDVVRCILRQALKGLNYLHINGFIHRDVKAANLLIDDDGTVLLGDLGVAADLSEESSQHIHASHLGKAVTATTALNQMQPRRLVAFDGGNIKGRPKIGKRKSFVGTPCWMAPELIEGRQYDSAADIWSFGITALELSQGRPPRSRESPKDVLLRIIHDAPPTLDREGGTFKYSRAFKEMVDSCLVKEPSKRPTAEQLLQTPFFRGAKKKSYLINTILKDLPPLTRRQERRATRHPPTVSTIDSWDFATTVNSPTSTIHHRRRTQEDFSLRTPEREKRQDVFRFDNDPNLHEDHDRSTTSSSEGDVSTDTADRGLSTPPTDPSSFMNSPPSPKLLSSAELSVESSSVPRSEESVKKGFWSRITPKVRRPSSSRGTDSPGMHTSDCPADFERTPRLFSKPVLSEAKSGGCPQKSSTGRTQLSKEPGVRPSTSGGNAHTSDSFPVPKKDSEIISTIKSKRPGNIFGDVIGGARSRLSRS